MRRLAASVVLLVSVIASSVALADAPSTMSYQGVLTNDDGTFVPDGSYNLTFRLYDVAAGGAALHTENHPAVAVERGGFSVILGSISALPVIFDRQIYLGVQVAADPELTPRVALASSPYAMGLRFPVNQTQSHADPLLEIRNTTGLTARLHGASQIGSASHSGELDLIRVGVATEVSSWYTTPQGANLDLYDEAFNPTAYMQADASGTGGFFSVRRNPTLSGFAVDGNHNGTNEPQVTISGSARSATFDMGLSGNTSVVLPTDAISATETLDEPGVASINQSVTTALDGTVQTLQQRSISVPAAGYCLVMGSVEAQAIHNNGLTTNALFGVSDAVGVLPGTQDFNLTIPSGAPTGTYVLPVTVHGLFTVNAGPNTFYLLGDETSGSLQFSDVQLSIVYFPTAYGTVTPSLTSGDGDGMSAAAPRFGAAESREAEAFHRARVDREMAAMQAQMDELRRKLEQVESEQTSVAVRKGK